MSNSLASTLKGDAELVNLSELSDEAILYEFLHGRRKLFDEIVRRYCSKICGLAYKLTLSRYDAEDICQSVFLILLNKMGSFEGRASFSSWVYRVALNASYDYLRRRKATIDGAVPLREEGLGCGLDTPDDLVFRREVWKKVEGVLSNLSEGQKIVFLLVDWKELSVKEVAQILGLSTPCVKSRLHRARFILRRVIGKELEINATDSKLSEKRYRRHGKEI